MPEQRDNFDAVLVVSFGGPEGVAEVMPFLENVLRGRNVPRERMLEVAHHYERFGGVSPINSQNRALVEALKRDLEARRLNLPVYFGNRNWHPLLPDTLRRMADDGVRHALAFLTSPYSSYSGCRQYREDIQEAQAAAGPGVPQVSILRKFYNHPGFVEPSIEHLRVALKRVPQERRAAARVAFTAHSIPSSMARGCSYEAQLRETSRLVAQGAGVKDWELVYQSRSGSPVDPWLEPDIADHLRTLAAGGAQDVVVMPIGFISDHMEVLYDLDCEAAALARDLGLNMIRVSTIGTHARFVSMIGELVVERMSGAADRPALGVRGPGHDVCPVNCCLPARRGPAAAAVSLTT